MSETIWRKCMAAACGAAALGVGGCYSGPNSTVGPAVTQPILEQGQAQYVAFPSDSYVLKPNDVINVVVFREADLSLTNVPISGTGEISVPLLGTMRVSGLTTTQLEGRLEELLAANYLRFPNVTVNVVQYASHLVTVEGSVMAPGVYNFSPGMRLSGAVALANGPSRVAKRDDVAVFRQVPDGIAIAKFDYVAIQSGTMMDPVLEPGDRVVIGLNNLSVFWQDVLQTVPLVGWFTRF